MISPSVSASSPDSMSSWLRISYKFSQTLSFLLQSNSTMPPAPLASSFLSFAPFLLPFTLALALTFVVFQRWRKRGTLPSLPPGPKPLPIIGNLLDIPTNREYETYTKWGAEYGDVTYLSALGNDLVILNSVQAANDLLDKRALIYSDRPYIPMVHEDSLMGFNWTLIFMNYSPAWRRQRRLFAKYIPNSASVSSFRSRQSSSAHNFLRLILKSSTPTAASSDPLSYRAHMRTVFSNILVGVAYGLDVVSGEDPHINLCERSVQLVNYGLTPGSYLVNLFPLLRHIPAWVPYNRAKALGKVVRQTHAQLVDHPMNEVKSRLAAGTAVPSFVTNALLDRADALAHGKGHNEDTFSEDDIKHIAASMYGAGFDTTFAPLLYAILNMLLNPSIQQKARLELDAVLGSPDSSSFRLPSWEDRPNLPYINALLQESLRWIPPTPGGLPHTLSREFNPSAHLADSKPSTEPAPTKEYDTYRKWRIPRGSTIIANVYGMLHDPKVYHDPYSFKPERFLREEYTDSEGNVHVLREPEPHPALQGVFGFGRRICPGQYLADSILWIELVSLIACFELVPARDEQGNPIDVTWAKTPVPAFVLHPPAFPCLFKPRSDIVIQRITETEP